MRRSLEWIFGAIIRSRRHAVKSGRQVRRTNSFHFESLEPRIALAAAGLVPVGTQPTGPLTGKIVYTSAGHGLEWEGGPLNKGWLTDRPDYNEIVEDFGNQDQLTFYADYLLRAGATVVPMRPVGRQTIEVVLDNDSAGVTYTGSWSNSAGGRWYDEDYGIVADPVHYRFASTTSGAESAAATYTPNILQAGFYPVYTWASPGTNRTAQLYKVNHTGGQTQIRVDHSMVGNGWVYLGTYHFNAGSSSTAGSVQISNEGAAGKVVIADAIRFGNGMGDVKDGPNGVGHSSGAISGAPREDESSYMWLYRGIGLGITPSSVIGTGNVSAPSNMAEHMNQDSNPFGTSVYIGFHSNGTTGNPATATARGAVGLIDADAADQTPNQSSLALYTGRQINQDMQALGGVFEHNWSTRTTHTYSSQFGEIDLGASAEMDATIIEVGFHDNTQDSQLLRDPKVRDQLARSTYQATLEYFDNFGGLTNPVSVPTAPTNVRAASNASGEVTISWSAGSSSPASVYGGGATGFRIYASDDGYGFDGGTLIPGGGVTSATLTGYDPTIPYYFKVVAVNAGGESKASEVMSALPSGGTKQVLIVNGFDRSDRNQNFRYSFYDPPGNFVDRVWARYNNSFDYVVQVHAAIDAAAPGVRVASTSNEAVISGAVNLTDYDTVLWILGEESTVNDTFSATEQTKVTAFLAPGGKLFVSGAEIGWDLEDQGGGASFYNNTLKADFVANDANSYSVTGAAGSIFAGLGFSFDNGQQFYNVDAPDRISPLGVAATALTYSTGGAAGIQYADAATGSKLVMLAFPFETITTAANRAAVMERILEFFELPPPPTGDFDDDGVVDGADFLTWQRNLGATGASLGQGDANGDGEVDAADLAVWQAEFGGESIAAAAAAKAPQPQQPSSATQPTPVDRVSLAQHADAVLGAAVVAEPRSSFRPAIREMTRPPAWKSVVRDALAPESVPDKVEATQMPRRDEPPGEIQSDAEAIDSALDQLAAFSWQDVRRY